MKKLLILICIILILFLSGCKGKRYSVTNERLYDLYNVRVMDAGEKEMLNVDYFDLEFNRVEFFSSNENVARINYKEELITLRTGRSKIKAIKMVIW